MESLELLECSICSQNKGVGCYNCPTSHQLGFFWVPATITAATTIWSTIYSTKQQRKMAKEAREAAERERRAAEEALQQQIKAERELKLLELSRPSFGINPTTLILIAGALVFAMLVISTLKK